VTCSINGKGSLYWYSKATDTLTSKYNFLGFTDVDLKIVSSRPSMDVLKFLFHGNWTVLRNELVCLCHLQIWLYCYTVIGFWGPLNKANMPKFLSQNLARETTVTVHLLTALLIVCDLWKKYLTLYLRRYRETEISWKVGPIEWLSPFYGAIAVPSVTRCRCRCGHRFYIAMVCDSSNTWWMAM